MDSGSIERLFLRQGENATEEQIRRLESLVARQGKLSGPGVLQTHLPWGTITSTTGSTGSGGTSPIFLPEVRRRRGSIGVSFGKGLIAGVEPKINETLLSAEDPETHRTPVFAIPDDAFDSNGEASVYFRCQLGKGWGVEEIEVFASATVPVTAPWEAHKLACVVYDDGSVWRALYSNQGLLSINRRSSGLAQHLFWGMR